MYTGQEYSVFIGRFLVQEECDDTKGVIRIRKSKKNRQHNGQKKNKRTKGQTTIYKAYTYVAINFSCSTYSNHTALRRE